MQTYRRWPRLAVLSILGILGCRPHDTARAGSDNAGQENAQKLAVSDITGGDLKQTDLRHARPRLTVPGDSTMLYEGNVETATLLNDYSLAVLLGNTVRLFDREGRLLRSFGGTGSGPGEFESAHRIARLSGDSLMISDGGPFGKAAVFLPTGKLIRERRWTEFPRRHWAEGRWSALPDGSRLASYEDTAIPRTTSNRRPAPGASIGAGHLRMLYRVAQIGPSVDTVYPLGIKAGPEQHGILIGGQLAFIIHPFYSGSVIAAGGNPLMVAIATNPEYRIEVWTQGVLTRTVVLKGARRRPTASEIKDAREQMAQVAKNLGGSTDDVEVPDSLPAIREIAISPDNYMYVTRDVDLPSQDKTEIDVFDPRGRWIRVITLPAHFKLIEAGRSYILGVMRDSDDVPQIELFDVPAQ